MTVTVTESDDVTIYQCVAIMMANCTNCSSCTFLTLPEQLLLYDVKYWMEGVTQLSLAGIGVTTNLVSIYVLSRQELVNTFNQLLIALAIFDILYLIIAFLDSLGKLSTRFYIKDTYNLFNCLDQWCSWMHFEICKI